MSHLRGHSRSTRREPAISNRASTCQLQVGTGTVVMVGGPTKAVANHAERATRRGSEARVAAALTLGDIRQSSVWRDRATRRESHVRSDAIGELVQGARDLHVRPFRSVVADGDPQPFSHVALDVQVRRLDVRIIKTVIDRSGSDRAAGLNIAQRAAKRRSRPDGKASGTFSGGFAATPADRSRGCSVKIA